MPSFYPSRASPQASSRQRLKSMFPNLGTLDTTASSATSSASVALAGLTDKDVKLIDEIIERSSPAATTFLTVFKAYNEVLAEKQMDAANDVTYYKLLLKLGVVKGQNWGAKWEAVKAQHGYNSSRLEDLEESTPTSTPKTSRVAPSISKAAHVNRLAARNIYANNASNGRGGISPAATRIRQLEARLNPSRLPLSPYIRDSVTVRSYQDESSTEDQTETDTVTETNSDLNTETDTGTGVTEEQASESEQDFSSSPTTLIQREHADDTKENRRYSKDLSKYPPLPSVDQFLPVQVKNLRSEPGFDFSGDLATRTSTPPPRKIVASSSSGRTLLSDISSKPLSVAQPISNKPNMLPERPLVVSNKSIDEEDAWKKVKMERDEKGADKFREIMLLERCWQVWRGSFEWVQSMTQKVDSRTEKLLQHRYLQIWKQRLKKRNTEYLQIGTRHDKYLLRQSLIIWRSKLKEIKVKKWKMDMRRRMSLIKTNKDNRILKEAWAKWKLRHLAEISETRYEQKLLWKMILAWRERLSKVEHMEEAADELALTFDQNRAVQLWDFWKMCVELRENEKIVKNQVHRRLLGDAMNTWKQRRSLNGKADMLHDKYVIKHFYMTWKKAYSKHQALVQKADKYKNRQDSILLLAVYRMWIARERGQLMDRTMKQRRVNSAWLAWKARIEENRKLETLATEFRHRPSAALAKSAFDRWRRALKIKRSIQEQAIHYDQDLLVHRMLLIWRINLRVRLKKSKHAKAARKFLLVRNTWEKWKNAFIEKKRQEKLKNLERQIQRAHFEKWRLMATRQRQDRTALQHFEAATTMRLMKAALRIWTNKVIALKLRELEVVEKRDSALTMTCFDKWRAVSKRHADDLRLMQSYQFVKREEILRRMFARWLSATKQIRYRRKVLQEREEEMKLSLIEKAWDRWRERFQEERLKPLELAFNIQLQRNRVYQAYLIWHSKTKSIPAIQFSSSRTKAKFWAIWRNAMPKALQAREARQHDRKKLLSRALDKWANAYRVKIALKAVARARYLRLPSGAPRHSLPLSTALRGVLRSSPSVTSGKTTRRTTSEYNDKGSDRASTILEDDLESIASRQRPAYRATKLSLARPISRPKSDTGASKELDIDLWKELRRAQRKKPPSER